MKGQQECYDGKGWRDRRKGGKEGRNKMTERKEKKKELSNEMIKGENDKKKT